MSRIRSAVLALSLAAACPLHADGHAQVDAGPGDRVDIIDAEVDAADERFTAATPEDPVVVVDNALPGGTTGDDPLHVFPFLADGFAPDDATRAAIQAAVRAQYETHTIQLEHRVSVFAWQHASSQVLFVAVLAIVAMGLYFSWMQFRAERGGAVAPTTTLKAGQSGIEVSSPVLGVVILALSLGFFYLYLAHVYPITEI
ncbi:hypothetical protein ACK8OR_04440 [Jannaschia sp. KMU-145]|uniref:hypothetical protein n=1 Tax=Jannaschia halovivens TaxID=3388667 RepID=UPI00396B3FBD